MAAFTLRQLLDLDLGLTLVSGDADALRRPVTGAHSTELERPAAWLDRDWILLTTGLRLQRRTAAQRTLVADLTASGAAAIGFGLGFAYRRVPSTLLEEAAAARMPVFTVPYATPFHEIVRAVYRAQSGADAVDLTRLSAMQLQLLDALSEPAPRQALVDRLAALTNAAVLLVTPAGTLDARCGPAPTEALLAAIRTASGPVAELRAGGRHVLVAAITRGAHPAGRLALVSQRPHPAGRLTRPAARAAARILAALANADDAAMRRERAAGRALLTALLGHVSSAQARELQARAAILGVDLSDGAAVVVLRGRVALAPDELADAWEAHAAAHALPQLSAPHGADAIVALVRDPLGADRPVVESFLSAVDAVAGVGRPADAVTGVARSFRDARLALQGAGAGADDDAPSRISAFADLDLAPFLAGSVPVADVMPLAATLLAPLREQPHLLETLEHWFANDCDAARTASALRLQPNSLRYRLARIEQLIRRPLRNPRTIASLYLALTVDDGTAQPGPA